MGVVQHMPQLGADNAGNDGHGHHPHRIRLKCRAAEAAVHDKGRRHGGQPQHQPEGGDG